MPSEGSRQAGGLETAKGAVRERIGLARQPRHSRMEGIMRKRGRDAFAKRLAIARLPLIDQAPVSVLPIFPSLANVVNIMRCRNLPP